MKLGSLFDGSGGFPLAGAMLGIEPAWASEIEPYPISVTTARFPNMKHLGDVKNVNGSKIEPVDIITFGSPCQDLSTAGFQRGIVNGERSNLFFEAIRIIKEMRGATDGRYPKYAVWENVAGCLQSNSGNDFKYAVEAFCQIADESLHIAKPQNGRWHTAGAVVGNGFSIAWKVYNSCGWGIPQRRRRVYLVADFARECAGEILFDQKQCGIKRTQGEEVIKNTAEFVVGCDKAGNWFGVTEQKNDAVFRVDSFGHDVRSTQFSNNGHCDTLTATDYKSPIVVAYENRHQVNGKRYVLRKLTPMEYCRLQGFPDWWCDGVDGSDTSKYKMWGNGITLPCAVDVIGRIVESEENESA